MQRPTGKEGGGRAKPGLQMIRADLNNRLDRLETVIVARGPIGWQDEVARIATIAGSYGLVSAQRLAEGLGVALAAGGRGAAIGPWIERLRDAIGCDAGDEQAGDTWMASIMVRLAG